MGKNKEKLNNSDVDNELLFKNDAVKNGSNKEIIAVAKDVEESYVLSTNKDNKNMILEEYTVIIGSIEVTMSMLKYLSGI